MFPSRFTRFGAGFLILFFTAFLFAGRLLDIPFVSMGWGTETLQWLYILSMVIFFLSGVISAWFSPRVSSQLRLLIATVLSVSGVYIASFAAPGFPAPLYVGRMLLFSAGAGIAFQTVIFTLSDWFRDRKLLFSILLLVPVIVSLFLAAGPLRGVFSGKWDWTGIYRLYSLILGVFTAGGMLILDAPEKESAERSLPVTGMIVFSLSGVFGIVMNYLLCL